MSTTAPELFTTLSTGWADAVQQWLDQSQRMWDQLGAPLRDVGQDSPERHRHHHGCDCHDEHHDHHGHDPHDHDDHHGHDHHGPHGHGCHGCQGARDECCQNACDCCVPEADVVVHARVGERRVIPFRLHNAWRREREVTLAVGPWHLCSGEGLVVVAVLEAEKVVLKPCEHRVVRLGLAVMAETDEDSGGSGGPDEPNEGGRIGVSHRFTRDLEGCASAYADVRFEGCARPQRIAVVVSPTECDAVDVACDCGCC